MAGIEHSFTLTLIILSMLQSALAQLTDTMLNKSLQLSVDVTSVVVMLLVLWWIISGAFKRERCDQHRVEPRGYMAARRSYNKRLARQTIIPKKSISAAQQMQRRMVAERERQDAAKREPPNKDSPKRAMTEGERIAMLSNTGTSAASLGKGDTRRAHSDANKPSTSRREDKPQLRDGLDTKIPMRTRMTYLEKFFQHFLRSSSTRKDAIDNAEQEEKAVKDKSSTTHGYQVAAVNALKRLRDALNAKNDKDNGKPQKISHSAVLNGRHAKDVTVGARRLSNQSNACRTAEERELVLHSSLTKHLLSEELLISNGYPMWENEDKTKVTMTVHEMDQKRGKKAFVPDSNLQRTCCRCNRDFTLHKKGEVKKEECVYHFNRMIKKKRNSAWESVWGCCDGDVSSTGCAVADAHVFDTLRESDLESFMETPKPWGEADTRSKKVFSMDCEMVYTTWGPALARVSVVDLNNQPVLDFFVRPTHPIIDPNTRFSGLSMEDMEKATVSLEEARLKVFEHVNSETILIGHSLESDLKAMRLVHHRVVDTSVVFPHRMGPPYKNALRILASDILKRIIQEDVTGHDSQEDSQACMSLMLYKLKEEGIVI